MGFFSCDANFLLSCECVCVCVFFAFVLSHPFVHLFLHFFCCVCVRVYICASSGLYCHCLVSIQVYIYHIIKSYYCFLSFFFFARPYICFNCICDWIQWSLQIRLTYESYHKESLNPQRSILLYNQNKSSSWPFSFILLYYTSQMWRKNHSEAILCTQVFKGF